MKYPPEEKLRLAKLVVYEKKTPAELECVEDIDERRIGEWARQLRDNPKEDFEPKSTAAKNVANKKSAKVQKAIIDAYYNNFPHPTHAKIVEILAAEGMEACESTVRRYLTIQKNYMKTRSEEASRKAPAKRSRKVKT